MYQVSRRAQLIDLNKDLTNFRLRFECHGEDPEVAYQVCVTNQTELDTTEMSALAMRTVEGGSISGNIVADSNVYQNYFLVLKSDVDTNVQVIVDIEPIDPKVSSSSSGDGAMTQEGGRGHEGHDGHVSASHVHAMATSHATTISWARIAFGVLLVVLFLVIVYYIFRLSEEHDTSPGSSREHVAPILVETPMSAPTSSTKTGGTSSSMRKGAESVVDEIVNGL